MINFAEFKKFFVYTLIGSLVVAALVAVVTVLIGEFTEVSIRVLLTLLMVMVHSLVSLAFIWDDKRQSTFERLAFFINVTFIIIVVSFLTSIFGIWKIIPEHTVWQLYQSFFVVLFASLHGDILSKALRKEKYLDKIVYANYVFMAVVVVMLEIVIFTSNAEIVLGELFLRILAASGIVDGTLSILTIIFYKLYMNKHPKADNRLQGGSGTGKKKLSIWVWILIVYLAIQIVLPLLFFAFGSLVRLF